ncbi:AAA family ATPase [Paraburkholderia bryophila]|uniref:Putative ATPase n=1 Tax=Paraburkholderia bryophila TaxID=420952 RepID=A0A7Y9WDT1_9BURK|nr:AAA family ATPase [Paraburkholderia bryophila]NYH18872.1 putative ATPase [Paraburkholderia bryophila]
MAATTNGRRSGRDFKTFFGLTELPPHRMRPYSVLIVPSAEKVKGARFQIQVDIHVKFDGDVDSMSMSGFFGYVTSSLSEPADVRWLEDTVNAASDEFVPAEESQRFFTMLPAMDDYRRIVRVMGPDVASKVLLALNDLVALTELQARSDLPKVASATQVFQKTFIRTAEAFFAYKNAGPILKGLDSEQIGRMSDDIEVRFQLAGKKNRHELKFRFDHGAELPKRISVVIGKNGVGKSQALGRVVNAALAGDDSALREATTHGRVLINRVLAFAPTNESASVFPSELRKNPKVWYKRFALNRGGRVRRGAGVADMVLQVARSEGRIGNFQRWQLFLTAIQSISDWQQIALLRTKKGDDPVALSSLRVTDDGDRAPDLTVDAEHSIADDNLLDLFASIDLNKDPIRAVDGQAFPLSSGEISFLRFAAQASLYIENGSLLLLDEPETHLHPNFISQFVALLNTMLAQTGSAAVIATHSVYFVREVFREQVNVLRTTDDGFVFSDPLRLQTFGADVGSISYFVFGEDEPSKLAADVEQRLLSRYETWEQLYAAYKGELSPELLSSLRLALEGRQTNE